MTTYLRRLTRSSIVTALAALALVVAATGSDAFAQRRQSGGEPGQFDFYLLSLSWSPSFCETARGGSAEQQCNVARPFSFVVHGLWPQFERGFPESCQLPSPRLDHRIVDQMLDLMPARRLIFHEWDAHGTCSGLEQHAYFDLIRKARGAVTIPPQFVDPQQEITTSPGQVVDAFVKANQGLTPDGITIDCDRSRLREVRICMTKDLKFRACGTGGSRACRADSLVMPPVRGGR